MRYEIRLSCRPKRRGTYEILDATTLNLARSGALVVTGASGYLESKTIPQPGDPIRLEVALPAHTGFGQRCLACEAVAVRPPPKRDAAWSHFNLNGSKFEGSSPLVAASPLEVM